MPQDNIQPRASVQPAERCFTITDIVPIINVQFNQNFAGSNPAEAVGFFKGGKILRKAC
jgi:hypothetical protein